MKTVYIYVLDTLADWEIGHVTAELHSGRFFKNDAERVELKTAGCNAGYATTMGGLKVQTDCLASGIVVSKDSVLILPGADTWSDPEHETVIKKAAELLSAGGTVCAICGATAALASAGILDNRPHTSNGSGFLEMICPSYKGTAFFKDNPAVADTQQCNGSTLITAGSTGGLPWAKEILARLNVFSDETLAAWYAYFMTGTSESFFSLMNTLPKKVS